MIPLALEFDWGVVLDNREEWIEGLKYARGVGDRDRRLLRDRPDPGRRRAHRIPVISQLAAVYVEVIRNTPLLVQVFFIFAACRSSTSGWSVHHRLGLRADLGRRVQH